MKQTMHLIFILILISLRCDTTEPPPNKASLTLTLEDVSCTEAWLKLTTTNLPLPTSVVLKQNDQTRVTINLTTSDTLLYIDSLLPKQTYSFQVTIIQNPASNISSNQATATTLDTTSHNFTWQTWTFGEHSSSGLYDVAIINESNIWAVGEIYMRDSLGNNDPHAYNAVHWNGSEWTIKRIYFPTVCGSTSLSSYPAGAIFAFDDGQIWISSTGDKVARLQNGVQIDKFCLPSNVSMSINKLWGGSSKDLYAVGNGGNIAHYQNGVWTKIESGTSTNINDVWGIVDPLTQEKKIFCAVSFVFNIGDYKILTISSSNNVDSLKWNTGRRVHTIWTKDGYRFFVGGGGVYTNKRKQWEEITELPLYYSRNIRGKNLNDIFVVGDFGWRAHFNGVTWKVYEQLPTQPDILYSQQLTSNMLITVGERGNKAIIVVGKR
jgi:hypothetical protein